MTTPQLERVVTEEILTIRDVAQTLRFTERTVYAMVRAGEIPAFKVRKQWRLRRVAVESWIEAQAAGTLGGPA